MGHSCDVYRVCDVGLTLDAENCSQSYWNKTRQLLGPEGYWRIYNSQLPSDSFSLNIQQLVPGRGLHSGRYTCFCQARHGICCFTFASPKVPKGFLVGRALMAAGPAVM